jgi:hypothetical protein
MRFQDQTPAQFQAQETKRFVHAQLANLHTLLNRYVKAARAHIARHVVKFILTPVGKTYIATGCGICSGEAVTMVPRARHGPNVCPFVSSGWLRHKSEASLAGLDLGTFGRRLALGGCRVVRLAGIEDRDECVYGGDQAN